jgi:hypothetical protein
MDTNIDLPYALIQYINSRPDGDMLRDIAIRTLQDMSKRDEYTDSGKSYAPQVISVTKHNRKRVNTIRILPSILYKKMKLCKEANFQQL